MLSIMQLKKQLVDLAKLYFQTFMKDMDQVAYIRFASVYRRFQDVNSFIHEINQFLEEK